jgi:hypothetical protein
MRHTSGYVIRAVGGTAIAGAILAGGLFHPWVVGLSGFVLVAALLLPPALLALLLRTVKIRDRHASFRLARPAPPQAFPPAAFGNSSGGRNVS